MASQVIIEISDDHFSDVRDTSWKLDNLDTAHM